MVQKVIWTKRALKDLRDIYDFIAKDSSRYAQIQIETLQDAAINPKNFPQIGRKLPEFPHSPYREILVGNYRIIYRQDEKEKEKILVMAVVHGRRLLKKHLKG